MCAFFFNTNYNELNVFVVAICHTNMFTLYFSFCNCSWHVSYFKQRQYNYSQNAQKSTKWKITVSKHSNEFKVAELCAVNLYTHLGLDND